LKLFEDIFIELEAFDYKCEVFIKIARVFEDIFREMEASIRNLGFLKDNEFFLSHFQ
jgi:hypothetical protein